MPLNPIAYSLYMEDMDVNANDQTTVLGKEPKKQEKFHLPLPNVICGIRYLEVIEIFQGKIWRILKESWTEFYLITQIYPDLVTVVMSIPEVITG